MTQERVALVTGGARGIGRAISLRLAGAGNRVAIGDLRGDEAATTVAEITQRGGSGLALDLDVTDPSAVAKAIEAVTAHWGPPEILVNNAGWDRFASFASTDEEFWWRVVDINYIGVLRMSQAVMNPMVERSWGRIINVGSDAGRVGSPLEAVYSGAKGAVIAFTKALARELGGAGVTANTVCPGPTETPLLDEMTDEHDGAARMLASMTKAIPMKRIGQVDEVAAAVAFFASEDAGFITGQTLSASGGLTMA